MFKYIHFIGTGCGKPLVNRKLPCYLVELNRYSVLLECGCQIPTDLTLPPINVAQIDAAIITAPNIELFAGLPTLLHSMRLLNRVKPFRLIAPEKVYNLVEEMFYLDEPEAQFSIEYSPIEQQNFSPPSSDFRLLAREAVSMPGKYQVFLQSQADQGSATLFYTGKSTGVADHSLLIGDRYVIHDCTYAYEDANLTSKTGLASYKDVLETANDLSPKVMFLVHYSTRYERPWEDIDKLRVHPPEVIKTFDGYRYDFRNMLD